MVIAKSNKKQLLRDQPKDHYKTPRLWQILLLRSIRLLCYSVRPRSKRPKHLGDNIPFAPLIQLQHCLRILRPIRVRLFDVWWVVTGASANLLDDGQLNELDGNRWIGSGEWLANNRVVVWVLWSWLRRVLRAKPIYLPDLWTTDEHVSHSDQPH